MFGSFGLNRRAWVSASMAPAGSPSVLARRAPADDGPARAAAGRRRDGARRRALDLRRRRNADDGPVPSGERPRERGPLFTPRVPGVVSRRLARPSARRRGGAALRGGG